MLRIDLVQCLICVIVQALWAAGEGRHLGPDRVQYKEHQDTESFRLARLSSQSRDVNLVHPWWVWICRLLPDCPPPPRAAPATKAVFLTTSHQATEHHFLLPTPSPSESWVRQDWVVAPIMFRPGALCFCCSPQGGLCYTWYLGSTIFRSPYCVWDVLVCCN